MESSVPVFVLVAVKEGSQDPDRVGYGPWPLLKCCQLSRTLPTSLHFYLLSIIHSQALPLYYIMFSGSLLSTHCQYLHSCQHDFEFQQYLWSRQSFPGQPNKYTYAGILWHTVEHLEFWGGANTLNSGGVISTTLSAVGPDDIPFTIQYINDNHWLKDFILDAKKANWDEWSLQVSFLTDRQGFTDWLDGSLAQPDKS